VLHSSPGLQLCWSHLHNAWRSTTSLGAPQITVMYSVCNLIYVSMYLYSYPSTHAISGLAAVCRIYTPRHPVHLRYHCISAHPPSLPDDILDRARLRCTWRRRLSELRDALGDWDRVNSEMHLEAGIVRGWRCTWRPWSCELAGRNRASLEIHLEAVIERDWTRTWRRPMDGAPGLNSSVSLLATMGMWQGDFTFEALMENWLVAVDR